MVKKTSLLDFASEYWAYTMDESASDVCGILNLGPSAGLALAVLSISSSHGYLGNSNTLRNEHPIDALRMFLAADVIRGISAQSIPPLDPKIAEGWGNKLEEISMNYLKNKNEFLLEDDTNSIVIPFEPMREIIKTVANSIAFVPLISLENHYLAEINTWSNIDEKISVRVSHDLLDNKEPSLDSKTYKETIYPAHIISGSIVALGNSSNLESVTNLAITSLSKLYEANPVWKGFPIRYQSNMYRHNLYSASKNKLNVIKYSNVFNSLNRNKKSIQTYRERFLN